MNVLVSTAALIENEKMIVMVETKNTPPPIPAITETTPDIKPSKSNIKMR